MRKLFHLSLSNLNNKTLIPRIPNNFMTKNNFEDNKTPRISFSTNIDGALTGISDDLDGKVFYVHEPLNYNNLIIKRITNEEVPDQSLTNEVWVLNPCKLKTIGKIRVSDTKSQIYKYEYGEFSAETYKWKYIYIKETEE